MWIVGISVLIVILVIWYFAYVEEVNKTATIEESFKTAEDFILNKPTYSFDGRDLNHVQTSPLRCPYCWEFVFNFTSTHGGYGDRTGKIVTQVITPHTAKVVVNRGRITSAILDEKWDMIDQKLIEK